MSRTELPTVDEGEERCDGCRYWRKIDSSRDDDHIIGECRRYAPTIVAGMVPEGATMDAFDEHERRIWPETDDSDWCGEWRAKKEGNPYEYGVSALDV